MGCSQSGMHEHFITDGTVGLTAPASIASRVEEHFVISIERRCCSGLVSFLEGYMLVISRLQCFKRCGRSNAHAAIRISPKAMCRCTATERSGVTTHKARLQATRRITCRTSSNIAHAIPIVERRTAILTSSVRHDIAAAAYRSTFQHSGPAFLVRPLSALAVIFVNLPA